MNTHSTAAQNTDCHAHVQAKHTFLWNLAEYGMPIHCVYHRVSPLAIGYMHIKRVNMATVEAINLYN